MPRSTPLSDNNVQPGRTIEIDPVHEGVHNRIAEGSVFQGDLRCSAGLWIEGKVIGNIEVQGVLVLGRSGEICGDVLVRGHRAVLAGTISPRPDGETPHVVIEGLAEMAHTLQATADFTAVNIDWHHGARIDGKVRTGTFPAERDAA